MSHVLIRNQPQPTSRRTAQPAGDNDAPESCLAGTTAETLVLVIAPSTGRFRPESVESELMLTGAVLGRVTGGGGRSDDVRVPVDAELADLLVRPGQLVQRGQGLAWMQRRDTLGAR